MIVVSSHLYKFQVNHYVTLIAGSFVNIIYFGNVCCLKFVENMKIWTLIIKSCGDFKMKCL